jgi:hypothetical protein
MTSPTPPSVPLASLLRLSPAAAPRARSPPRRGVRWTGGRRNRGPCWAAAVEEAGVLFPKEEEEDEATAARYDWKEEWYPLYLAKEVPDDAALPLAVFDRQLVLYRDAAGALRCHEDRCPHRYRLRD